VQLNSAIARAFRKKWKRLRLLTGALGARAIWHLLGQRMGFKSPARYRVHPRCLAHPVGVRPDSSDVDVYRQIFIKREYGCLDAMTEVGLVIDCGANVGYSSAWFLSRFPTCKVVAIEPDSGNFAALQANLAPYGNRVKLVRAGVWSHSTGLVMSEHRYRDGREWSRQVRPCELDEEADFEGVDVGSLLASSGHERISILKVDVEGAEAVMFAENYQSWLNRVDCIAIELHDDSTFGSGSEVFFSAIRGQDFQVRRSGELTICRRGLRLGALQDAVPVLR